MTIVDWATVLTDIETGLKDADAALMAAAAYGVPDAALVDPFVKLAEGIVERLRALQAGTLTPLAASVAAADTQAEAALDAKFPAGGT